MDKDSKNGFLIHKFGKFNWLETCRICAFFDTFQIIYLLSLFTKPFNCCLCYYTENK